MSRPSETLPSGLSRLQQINEQCNRFEAAWKSGARPRIEEYLAPAPTDFSLLRQLVLLDVDYRRKLGDCPRAEDYLDRFPHLDRPWLLAALADDPSASGSDGTIADRPWARVSAGEFLDRLAAHGLLSDSEHRALRDGLAALPHTSMESLAALLRAQGKVAEFQVRALTASVPIPLVLGPYVLDGWIAAGGMGNVFRATHRQMRRTVAVKVLHGGPSRQRERFQREVEVAARLRHPHVITAFDAGEQDGVTYLVTEFVDGEDLRNLLKREGRLEVTRAVGYVRQAALGLRYAHEQGVVHRDVKPSNLILGRDGVVRVLDVGLARAARMREVEPLGAGSTPSLTPAGALLGTVDYIAPEQAEDPRGADERSDVYGLGCTLFFLLTGRPPYDGGTPLDRLLAHRSSPTPSVRDLRRDVSPALDAVVRRMMAKNPAERQPHMATVLAALDAAGGSARRFSRRALLLAGGTVGLAGVAYWFGFRGEARAPLPPTARVPFDARAEQARWAAALGVPAVSENVAGMRMVFVPPGSFLMGTPDEVIREQVKRVTEPREALFLASEKQREQTISKPYYLSATEVTIGQFRRFVEASRPRYVTLAEKATDDAEGGWGWNPRDGWRRRKGFFWGNADEFEATDDHSISNVAWGDAQAFCRWLTDETGQLHRLPTEAECEFACRAGGAGLWCFGDRAASLPDYGWFVSNSGGLPQPVARKRANALGLHDMHGNHREWCAVPESADDGDLPSVAELGHEAHEYQPVRGGGFVSPADRTRCGARDWEHGRSLGPSFRVLQVLDVDR
jgi:formylglycine-generating enzyme required for sulfatase activity